jgi:hypothetical protein
MLQLDCNNLASIEVTQNYYFIDNSFDNVFINKPIVEKIRHKKTALIEKSGFKNN